MMNRQDAVQPLAAIAKNMVVSYTPEAATFRRRSLSRMASASSIKVSNTRLSHLCVKFFSV
jgi:hypothetical protein